MENMEKCWRYPNWILRIEMQIRFVKIYGLENASTQKVTLDLVGLTKTFAVSYLPPCLFAFHTGLVVALLLHLSLCKIHTSSFAIQLQYFHMLIYFTYILSVILNNFHSFESKASSMSKSAAAFLLARPAACSWWLARTSNRGSIHVVPHKPLLLSLLFPATPNNNQETSSSSHVITCLYIYILNKLYTHLLSYSKVIHSQGRIAWIQSHSVSTFTTWIWRTDTCSRSSFASAPTSVPWLPSANQNHRMCLLKGNNNKKQLYPIPSMGLYGTGIFTYHKNQPSM